LEYNQNQHVEEKIGPEKAERRSYQNDCEEVKRIKMKMQQINQETLNG
jgi:hypothetical protein